MRQPLIVSVVAGGVLASCSLLTDFDGYTAGANHANGGSDADVPSTAGGEDCTNGVDDDHDGVADCADPKCRGIGYACRTVPEGWQGPYVVAFGSTVPSCASPWGAVGLEGHDGLVAAPATCDCSCGPVTGATCFSNVIFHDACGSGSLKVSPDVPETCTNLGAPPGGGVSNIGYSGVPGSCEVNIKPQAPATWTRAIRGCGSEKSLSPGGCSGSAVCAPPALSGFARGSCITHDGDAACPADFPTESHAYLGLSDDRKCEGCSCGAPTPCPKRLVAFENADCSGSSVTVSGSCQTFSARSARVGDGTPRTCTLTSGTASGTAAPSQATTVCCTQ